MMGPNGQNTFLLEKHPPIREHIAQIRVRRILHYFSNLVKYRASRKKVTIRMLLAPRCTGSIASSWHPESTVEIMGPLNTARAYLCNTSKGLHKLFYPAIPDGRTWSKFWEQGVSWKNIEKMETSTRWLKSLYLGFKTLFLWLKTLYLSTRWLKTLSLKAFLVTLE